MLFNDSTWSAMVLTIISTGTARIRPSGPHNQPQNMTAMKIDTEVTRAARPSAIGASRNPSSEVIATDVSATSATMPGDRNCITAASDDATMMMVGPKYGMQLSTPAATPHS